MWTWPQGDQSNDSKAGLAQVGPNPSLSSFDPWVPGVALIFVEIWQKLINGLAGPFFFFFFGFVNCDIFFVNNYFKSWEIHFYTFKPTLYLYHYIYTVYERRTTTMVLTKEGSYCVFRKKPFIQVL